MNRFLSALTKIGHVSKVVAVDSGKVAIKAVEFAAPIATSTFAPALEPLVFSGLEQLKKLCKSPIDTDGLLSNYFNFAIDGGNMNPLEAMAITMILGVLQTTVKNPQHRAALQGHLLALADDIYIVYGLTPANHSVSAPSPTV